MENNVIPFRTTDPATIILAGDVIVSGASGKRFKVVKINPKNYKCLDENGQGWNVRRAGARKAEDQTWNGPAPKNEYQLYVEAAEQGIMLGSVVEFTRAREQQRFPGKHVCIAKNAAKWYFAKLGGDGDRRVHVPVESVSALVRVVEVED